MFPLQVYESTISTPYNFPIQPTAMITATETAIKRVHLTAEYIVLCSVGTLQILSAIHFDGTNEAPITMKDSHNHKPVGIQSGFSA